VPQALLAITGNGRTPDRSAATIRGLLVMTTPTPRATGGNGKAESVEPLVVPIDASDAFSDLETLQMPPEATTDATDIFTNLEALKLTADEASQLGTEEVLVNVDVRKPANNEFVRVTTDPKMSLATSIYIDRDREVWFVPPKFRPLFPVGLKWMLLTTAVNQRAIPFLWPLALGDGGQIGQRKNKWHETAREAAEMAKKEWVKVASDMPAGCYRIFKAKGKLPEPVFPSKTLSELLRLAFRGRVIDREDHPAVQQADGTIP
jgi:hypothetical protein